MQLLAVATFVCANICKQKTTKTVLKEGRYWRMWTGLWLRERARRVVLLFELST